MKITNS